MRLTLVVLVAWLGLFGPGQAQGQSATSPAIPALTGRVVDEAGILPEADRTALTMQLANLEAKTRAQLVVVTLKSLQGMAIEDYGYQLGRRWQVGERGRNSGALLIVVPTERLVRIEVGYGLEGTLTDAATKLIIETAILPKFRAGDLPGGIRAGVDQVVRLLAADDGSAPGRPARTASSARPGGTPDEVGGWPLIVGGVVAVGLLIFCAVSGGGACRGIIQVLVLVAMSGGRGGSSGGGSKSFSGGGGSFGGGGSSGRW